MSTVQENRPRVLCVDDDARILETHARSLSSAFDVETAENAQQALSVLAKSEPFAVVVSDMDMPGMDGASFLARVREQSPTTTRILVTGRSELDVAVQAINRGRIFRFLTKPSVPEELLAVVADASEQHRLVTAEKVLLEQTLAGVIQTLSELLSLMNPRVFEFANQARTEARALALALSVQDAWSIEVGAVLLQLATLTLPPDTLERVLERKPLGSREQAMLRRCPEVARKLIGHIPRLESVQACLQGGGAQDEEPLGAKIVKVVTEYALLKGAGLATVAALETMKGQGERFDPNVLDALFQSKGEEVEQSLREVALREVRAGMVLRQEVRTDEGIVIVAAGVQLTRPLIARLNNFAATAGVREPLVVDEGARSEG